MARKEDFDFKYVILEDDMNVNFAQISMTRICKSSEKYIKSDVPVIKTQRCRKNKIDAVIKAFENDLPALNVTHHIEIYLTDKQVHQLKIKFFDEYILAAKIQYDISSVENGICFCTLNEKDQTSLLNILLNDFNIEQYRYKLWSNKSNDK